MQNNNKKLGVSCECLVLVFKHLVSGLEERESCFQQKPATGCLQQSTCGLELCMSSLHSHPLLLPKPAMCAFARRMLVEDAHTILYGILWLLFFLFFLLFFRSIFNQKFFQTDRSKQKFLHACKFLSSSYHMQHDQVLMEVSLSLKQQCYSEQCITDQSDLKI